MKTYVSVLLSCEIALAVALPILPVSATTLVTDWVDEALRAVERNRGLGPTGASRAYGILGTAMYDAWSAYEDSPISTLLSDTLQRPSIENTNANKEEAISYAAYSVLADLFPNDVSIFQAKMLALGLDPDRHTNDITTAAGIGNVMAATLLDFRHQDGSNQLGNDSLGVLGIPYSDTSGYSPVNSPDRIIDIERWTPERIPIDNTLGSIQQFLTPHWGQVTPFGLKSGDQFRPPAPEAFLLVDGATVNLDSKTITLVDGTVVPIDSSIVGTIINPDFIAQAQELVDISGNLTDEQKLIAEFWEDGGGTSYPSGHWLNFGELVSTRDNHTLDDDVAMFFALGNAIMDAGIATWESKTYYDYTRPVRAIRELGKLCLIGTFDPNLGGCAIDVWAEPGLGTQHILASDFITYQTPGGNPSPPFAEYTSGHSAFSAAAAEILKLFTGSDEFNSSVTFTPGSSRFEPGITPQDSLTLSWGTFSEAADEAGISRRYGGIHFKDGDLNSRILGRQVGQQVWDRAEFYLNGGRSIPEPATTTAILAFGGLLLLKKKRPRRF